MFNFIKNGFKRRTLYCVHYMWNNETSGGHGCMDFKIYPKINSFAGTKYIRSRIAEDVEKKFNINNVQVIIINIMKLD